MLLILRQHVDRSITVLILSFAYYYLFLTVICNVQQYTYKLAKLQ